MNDKAPRRALVDVTGGENVSGFPRGHSLLKPDAVPNSGSVASDVVRNLAWTDDSFFDRDGRIVEFAVRVTALLMGVLDQIVRIVHLEPPTRGILTGATLPQIGANT